MLHREEFRTMLLVSHYFHTRGTPNGAISLMGTKRITSFTLCVKKAIQTLEYSFLCSLRVRIFVAKEHSLPGNVKYVNSDKIYFCFFFRKSLLKRNCIRQVVKNSQGIPGNLTRNFCPSFSVDGTLKTSSRQCKFSAKTSSNSLKYDIRTRHFKRMKF